MGADGEHKDPGRAWLHLFVKCSPSTERNRVQQVGHGWDPVAGDVHHGGCGRVLHEPMGGAVVTGVHEPAAVEEALQLPRGTPCGGVTHEHYVSVV